MNRTIRVAFCGVAAALEIVLLFLTNLVPTATIALPALAGVLLMAVVMEIGAKWSWAVFGISSVLAFFLLSDKEAFLMYLLFFGYYPTLKAAIENRFPSKAISWVIKLLVFNAAMAADVLVVIWFLGVPAASFWGLGIFIPLFWLAANVVFVIYDFALSGLVLIYWQRLHHHISRLISRKR